MDGSVWTKITGANFDVGMGSFDGAELCKLVGLFLLHKLGHIIKMEDMGLYRDDGLAAVNLSGPQTARLSKDITRVFKDAGLKVTVEVNIKITDFLDVHLNLSDGSYKPFMKENTQPMYINVCSNHPPAIVKQIPNMIQNRITNLSSSKEIFENEIKPYQEALITAGLKQKLEFVKVSDTTKTRTRKKAVTWYNPPFNASVTTNFAARFLRLVDKHFPKGSPLSKIFNRNTIKVSYSCLPNLERIISSHNKYILRSSNTTATLQKQCNCRDGAQTCPFHGHCLEKSVIYKAEVSTNIHINSINPNGVAEKAEYIGLAANNFKERYSNHLISFYIMRDIKTVLACPNI